MGGDVDVLAWDAIDSASVFRSGKVCTLERLLQHCLIIYFNKYY